MVTKKKDTPDAKRIQNWLKDLSHDEFVAKLVSESPIENELSKVVIAETVAACRKQLLDLVHLHEVQDLKVDERRIIPALASNIGRLLEKLETLKAPAETFDL